MAKNALRPFSRVHPCPSVAKSPKHIAIVGGGINGLCCAWELARQGHDVELFERGRLMHETSRASSKLLHGGLRYLETLQLRLVREALAERDQWFERAPQWARPLSIVIPIYRHGKRSRWQFGLGLWLYRRLAGQSPHRDYQWLPAKELTEIDPDLNPNGLIGGYRFTDGQMDDQHLGLWVAEQAKQAGARLHEQAPVERIDSQGRLWQQGEEARQFDNVVNVAGPWAEHLARNSGLSLTHGLDLVRGSHLVLNRPCRQAYLAEHPQDRRIFFILPWKEGTLLGTTEVRQGLDEPIACGDAEADYLLDAFGRIVQPAAPATEIRERFAGLRPLLRSHGNANRASREYAIERTGNAINVLGGKWTTAPALARKLPAIVH